VVARKRPERLESVAMYVRIAEAQSFLESVSLT